MIDQLPVRRALLSVSDKDGLAAFGRKLVAAGVELISTGGTAKALRDAGLKVADVSDVTGFPEMMDGRVKTLHPLVHGGLLGVRGNSEHEASMAEHGIAPIDLVVVNLYPFAETVARGAQRDEIIENIDIGGPSMVRSAAKNHAAVAIVTDPADYDAIAAEIEGGGTRLATRKKLAAKAFAATASYDSAIASWFAFSDQGEQFPDMLTLSLKRGATELRYGENPHQAAAIYMPMGPHGNGVGQAEQVQGKALSYNNLNDAEGALELISEFVGSQPTIAIIKHANPCGVAGAEDLAAAYAAALACDPVSAFGGIIAANRPLDEAAARAITNIFTEVVIAPDADEAARAIFAEKKNLRLLLTGELPNPTRGGLTLKSINGGYLVQSRDDGQLAEEMQVVSKRAPTLAEMADMAFAWRVAKHVKSNAIVYAKDGATAGIGAGQMSRLDSARIAAWKARDAAEAAGWAESRTIGSAVASDAFFPFADGLIAAAEAGATAIIQPGGSIRDEEVIAAADERDLAMAFTGMRHFRH
ncbi:bifunctional phosphoribosylaminoimidazolecarboxamide formyltransferase/IMP cyclohydrolase [Pacificimonas sp. ICDLI1SI03]